MNTKMISGTALAGLLFAGAAVGTVSAQTVAAQTGLTEEQAVAIALIEVPGEVQDIELERDDDTQVYEIEILAEDGSEMEVEINADTGDVIEVAAEDDDRDCDKDGERRGKRDRGDHKADDGDTGEDA